MWEKLEYFEYVPLSLGEAKASKEWEGFATEMIPIGLPISGIT
jgi:hypothetical protein